MASPLHDDVHRDPSCKCIADEGLAALVRADELVFRNNDVPALSAMVGGHSDGLIEAGKLAKLFQVVVHFLVGDDGKGLIVREGYVLVLVKDPLGDVVQVDGEAVGRLDSSDVDAVVIDVASPEVGHVRVPEAGEATEDKHVADPQQVLFALRDFIGQEHPYFVDGKEDNLLLSGGQLRLIGLECQAPMITVSFGPPHEPLEVTEMLDGRLVG